MRYTPLSTFLALSLLGVSSSAMATQVDASINADNRFVAVLTQNGTNTVVHTTSSNYLWSNTEKFSFNVDETNLKQCYISVVTWGDRASGEGFAGVFKSNNGAIYTNGSTFQSKLESKTNSGAVHISPTQTVIDNIVPVTSGSTTSMGSTNGHWLWGNITTNYSGADFGAASVPSDFDWVGPTGHSYNSSAGPHFISGDYFVFSAPCSKVVKAATPPPPPPPSPIDVPGDHFQCYRLYEGDEVKAEEIQIADQFGRSTVVLGKPVMICNPSHKRHNGKDYEMRNEKRHLVCYDYLKQEYEKKFELNINNQFGPDKVVSYEREMFCAPSLKEHVDRRSQKPSERRINEERKIYPRQQRR